MSAHIRNVRILSILFGVVFVAWAMWGLATEEHSHGAVVSWLIVLGFGALLLLAGAMFGQGRLVGRILIRVVSTLVFLYTLVWLFLGGVEDASGYWPGLLVGVAFALYASYVSVTAKAG